MKKFNRRDFIKITSVAAAGAVAVSVGYLHLNNEAQDLVVERVTIPIKGLKPALEGLKIVQMTDFHLLPYTKPDFVRKAVELANSLNPDLTVLTGDYVWHEGEAILELTPILAGLNARYGVYSALGNHDIWTDVNLVLQAFQEVRMPVLVNQGIAINAGGENLYLAGLDDGWSGEPDLGTALEDAPNGAPVILLFHEPDLADDVSVDPRISLQLAGHSHGGQIRLPGIGAPLLPYLSWKYDQGLFKVKDMWLYTNRGIGVTNIPIRYNCPPEITELILVKA